MVEPDDAGDATAPFLALVGDMGVLSREAFEMHSYGSLNSISDGHPGFVSDDYLNAISAETTMVVAELELAGLWERREGGYAIRADWALREMINFNEETDRLEVECKARGAHIWPAEDDGGWVICEHCMMPLERPDGGPVALPDGGPLGDDSSNET